MSELRYIIGLDPGLGVRSATGLAIIDLDTFEIVCRAVWPESKRNHEKFYEIASEVREVCKPYIKEALVATDRPRTILHKIFRMPVPSSYLYSRNHS